jgi:hypothetical protein
MPMKINYGEEVKFTGDISIYEKQYQKFLSGQGFTQKHFLQDEYINCIWVKWYAKDETVFGCWTHIKDLKVV